MERGANPSTTGCVSGNETTFGFSDGDVIDSEVETFRVASGW